MPLREARAAPSHGPRRTRRPRQRPSRRCCSIIEANGIKMRIAEMGKGPLVLFVHGFLESWYSWRHQLPALAKAGYRAVAPDLSRVRYFQERGAAEAEFDKEPREFLSRNCDR